MQNEFAKNFNTERINSLLINIDGAAKGNPGPAAIGILVRDRSGKILEEYKEFIGNSTNNFAEYKAAIRALEIAMRYCRNTLYIFTDSKLLVNQLEGNYRIRKRHLMELLIQIKLLQGFFKNVRWFQVDREKNGKADSLANSMLNDKQEANKAKSFEAGLR